MVRVRDATLSKRPRVIDNYGQKEPPILKTNKRDKYKLNSMTSMKDPGGFRQRKMKVLSLQTFTKIVATIQILFSSSMLLLVNVLSKGVLDAYIADNGWKVKTMEVASAISLFFGFLLLIGAHFDQPSLISLWLFISGGGLTLLLLIRCVIVCSLLITGGMLFILHFIPPMCLAVILAVCLHAVNLYRNQLTLENIQEGKSPCSLTSMPPNEPQTISKFTG